MHCPRCNTEIGEGFSECYNCGCELGDLEDGRWIVLGMVEDRVFAGLARETLESMGIPAVVVSKSGFFGNVGLPLNPFFSSRSVPSFEVSVPWVWRDEAGDALDSVLGSKWQRTVN
jgi:hypothetical protein